MADWKQQWEGSSKPSKQRKHRRNAPYHQRDKFLSVHLSEDLQESVGTRTLPVVEGDRAEIMRGDWADVEGTVEDVDRDQYKVYIDGVERDAVDGTESKVALEPSNLRLTKLNLDDERRTERFDIDEDDRDEISADEADTEDSEDDN